MTGAGSAKRPASPTRISPPPLKRKVEPTITKNAMSSFFTPASQKKPAPITWRIVHDSLVIGKYTRGADQKPHKEKRKIAAFDLDSTLISTASGNTFARNASDWKWWHTSVPGKIKELDNQGFQVVVLSNQKKISLQKDLKAGRSDSKSLLTFKEKVASIFTHLDVPMSVYAATKDDENRKPRTGMWKEFVDDYDLDVSGVDLVGSVFVGDAAGRQGDHSQVDLGFAANIRVPFKTPEEFFLNATPEPLQSQKPFDPTTYMIDPRQKGDSGDDKPTQAPIPFTRQHPVELVIFCGSPGAGKSTFFWNYLEPLGYERVNQDILKTRQKCLKVAREYLSEGKSVAVDNTNADPETRSNWITLATDLNLPIRCVYFISTPDLCRHNNVVRARNGGLNPESRTLLPGIAFGDFARRFQEPSVKEGFTDIVRVEFHFQGDEEAMKVWGQYWV